MVRVCDWAILEQYVNGVVLGGSPVETFEKLPLCMVGLIEQEVRRAVCSFGLEQAASTHEGAIFADVDFEGYCAEQAVFYFVMDLA